MFSHFILVPIRSLVDNFTRKIIFYALKYIIKVENLKALKQMKVAHIYLIKIDNLTISKWWKQQGLGMVVNTAVTKGGGGEVISGSRRCLKGGGLV